MLGNIIIKETNTVFNKKLISMPSSKIEKNIKISICMKDQIVPHHVTKESEDSSSSNLSQSLLNNSKPLD